MADDQKKPPKSVSQETPTMLEQPDFASLIAEGVARVMRNRAAMPDVHKQISTYMNALPVETRKVVAQKLRLELETAKLAIESMYTEFSVYLV